MPHPNSHRADTVLVVDDNQPARAALARLLARAGYDVRQAGGGREALRLAGEPPDLVVLDVVLPDLDGFEVCRRLKADPATAGVPVLMVSGAALRGEDKARGLEAGADAYLAKPVEPEELMAYARALVRARRAEESLRASERRYRLLFERCPGGLLRSELGGRILDCNDALVALLGYRSRGEVLALTTPGLYFDPSERGEVIARLRREGHVAERELRLRSRDGRPVWVLATFTLLGGPGHPEGVLSTLVDLTERKRLEEQYLQAQKMEAVGQLAGGVAHDFNNLLTIISGCSELLFESLPPDDARRELVREVARAGDRAAALTRQLLAFSRRQVLAPRVLDLNALVADLSKMLRRLIGEDVELTTVLQEGLWEVTADPGQLEQVLMNLAVNARDAMPRGGRLTVETANVELGEDFARAHPEVRPGRYVLLAVSDTGVGMTPEVQARIFEPFFTTKERGKGTGLGLATVYGIVQQSGGHVTVASEPGVGTTFQVYLPRAERAGRVSVAPAGRPAAAGSETVLLAEDDDAVRFFTRIALEQAGYAVLEATGGEEALALAERHAGPVHLLVTDVVMPRLGGRELAGRLQGRYPGLKVLFLSGYTDDAVVRHGVLHEEVNFLQKPFTPAALTQKVREVLDAPG